MTGFLDIPLELRNHIYDFLLREELQPHFRGVMIVSEPIVKHDLPLRCYRGLLPACRQINRELKQAIKHMVATKELQYDMTMTFSHGRPYFSLEWLRLPALSPTINHLCLNVDLRTQEPFRDHVNTTSILPSEEELRFLLRDPSGSFAVQLFAYLATLLKTLANLLSQGIPGFRVLYTESMTINLRTPTKVVIYGNRFEQIDPCHRRQLVKSEEAERMHGTMRDTLKDMSKAFKAYDASDCDKIFPLIQIGTLRFATEGEVWGEGHNLVLAHDEFHWLRY